MSENIIKAAFHSHTNEDLYHTNLKYSSFDLINKAVKLNFKVLAITTHIKVFQNKEAKEYAKKKGILLISGIEQEIEKKHVIILNPDKAIHKVKNFIQLKKYKKKYPNSYIIAAHPYFPGNTNFRKKLEQNIDIFDAIEYHFLYTKNINFNKKAVAIAEKYKKTLIGSSDIHDLSAINLTFTLINLNKKELNIKNILNALKNNQCKIKSTQLTLFESIKHFLKIMGPGLIGTYYYYKNRQ